MGRPQPKRVAWYSSEELHSVFTWLFASDGDVAAQSFGIERIKVWVARGGCPHPVESTANLLELILQDSGMSAPSTSARTTAPPPHPLKLAYSMAIVRFVNSLVDPLQTTYFARPMVSLAHQLGLPLWFVELRHRCTHEDLPSLSILRHGAKQALDWLYTHYWVPAITPLSSLQSHEEQQLADLVEILQPLLKTYKRLMKGMQRDASKASKTQVELKRLYKRIETCLQPSPKTRVEVIADCLLQVGAMVPQAIGKRCDPREPDISEELAEIWMPIFDVIDDLIEGRESLKELLLERIIEILASATSDQINEKVRKIERSYHTTLVAWAELFCTGSDLEVKERALKMCLLNPTSHTINLAERLLTLDEELALRHGTLVQIAKQTFQASDLDIKMEVDGTEAQEKLAMMQERLLRLTAQVKTAGLRSIKSVNSFEPGQDAESRTGESGAAGWKLVTNWTPCPIGALPGGKIVDLQLH